MEDVAGGGSLSDWVVLGMGLCCMLWMEGGCAVGSSACEMEG